MLTETERQAAADAILQAERQPQGLPAAFEDLARDDAGGRLRRAAPLGRGADGAGREDRRAARSA